MIANVLNRQMLPGVGTDVIAPVRNIFVRAPQSDKYFPVGGAVDGQNASDPGNPVNWAILRAGLVLGRITATNQYGTSIIGSILSALANGGTTLYVDGPTAYEINRRLGASGTLKLTGPATAGGTVRTLSVAYSAVATAAGNDAKVITMNANPTAGTFTITLYLAPQFAAGGASNQTVTTAAIAWNASAATVQAAINAVLGPNAVTVTMNGGTLVSNATSFTIAFTGYPYATMKQTDPTLTITGLSTTASYTVTYPTYVTITAPSANEIQTVNFDATLTAGTFVLGVLTAAGVWKKTPQISYSDSISTVQGYLDAITGVANGIVIAALSSTTVAAGFTLTFSGTGYAGVAQTSLAQVDCAGTALASSGGNVKSSVTRTTAGVSGAFIAGSFVQPADGSETPVTLLDDPYGYWIINPATFQRISIKLPRILAGGDIRTAMIIGYGLDTALNLWLKAALRSAGGTWHFDDDFLPGTV